MDTNKPPLMCPTCDNPIWPGGSLDTRYPVDPETGEPSGPLTAYHRGCAPALEDD